MKSAYEFLGSIQEKCSVYTLVSCAVILWGLSNLIMLQFTTAPYGRYTRAGWGVMVNAKLAWFLQELPSFVVPLVLIFRLSLAEVERIPLANKVALGCFIVHYFNRTFIFPLRLKGSKPIPLLPFLVAVFFCSQNGALQTSYLLHYNVIVGTASSLVRFLSGLLLFCAGMYVNIFSDIQLTKLRSEKETTYRVPKGFVFEYVSGANFLGEIVEWCGYAIMCFSLPALSFAIFTCCNIGPRAFHHHRFYQEKFEDYPRKRKALIPFIL